MIPIRLTDNHYINPSSVAEVEFRPKCEYRSNALFFASYRNTDLGSVQLFGDEAEEAFQNWTAAIAGKGPAVPVQPIGADQYQHE
jgi:endonuclease YncB( thermonuclease family)